jgi:hypothetical protein
VSRGEPTRCAPGGAWRSAGDYKPRARRKKARAGASQGNLGALVGFCLVATLFLVAFVLAWRQLGRGTRQVRFFGRLLLGPLALASYYPALLIGAPLGRSSWWQCDLCGSVEHRDECAGILLRRTPYSDPCAREVLDAYAAWTELFAGDHEHAWDATIASWRWPGISCTMLQPCRGWFQRLPGTGDQLLARRAWQAFITADLEQRRRWRHEAYNTDSQEDFERWLAETF